MRHISSLDALRGYCVLSVFAFHAGYVPFGWIGVQAFFVLSGFLITGILVTQKQNNGFGSYLSAFYARRALRIFPAYYFFLLLLILIWSLGLAREEMRQFGEALPYLFAYLENFHALSENYFNSGYYSHLWTLSIEEQFYLMWPLIVWAAPVKKLPLICVTIILISMLVRFGVIILPWSDHFRYFAANRISLCQFDAFAVGAVISVVRLPDSLKSLQAFIASCALMLLLGALMIYCSSYGAHKIELRSLGWSQEFPAAGAFVWGFTALNLFFGQLIAILSDPKQANANPIFGFFEFQWLRGLGKISYGFYIYHDPILTAATGIGRRLELPHSIISATALLCTICGAWASYVVVEKPFLRLKARWTYRTTAVFGSGADVSASVIIP